MPYFSFHDVIKLFGWWKGCDCRHANLCPLFQPQTLLLSLSRAVVIGAVCDFTLSCWNMQALVWKRPNLNESIYCLETCIHLSHLHVSLNTDGAFPAASTTGTDAPPYHQRCWVFSWMLITSQMVPLFFSPEPYGYRTVFHCATIHFKRALAQGRQQPFCITYTYGFFFASQSFNLHLWMALRAVFTDRDAVISVTESFLFLKQYHRRPEDYRCPLLIFGSVTCECRFLHILWIFWSYYAL